MIRAVTFDVAGTLLAPHPSVGAVYAEVAGAFGLERDAAELDERFPPALKAAQQRWRDSGRPPYGADDLDARRFWGTVIEDTFGEPLPYEIACELFDTFATARRWRVLPGAAEAVALVRRRRLGTAVVSNFDCRLQPLLADCGLDVFAAVVTSTMVGAAKPDPAVLREACRQLGVEPAEVLHLGDSEREDGAMCAAAGARWLRVDPYQGVSLRELDDILAAR